LAWTGVHGADVPVGAHACADAIVDADGRVATIFQAEGQEESEEESRQEEGAAEGTEEDGEEEEKGNQEETPPLTKFGMTPAGASR